jgi:hypothetical protein
MGDQDFLKWAITLGVGGILAAFMFIFYRKDMLQCQEQWRGQTEVLVNVVKENTSAIVTLTILLQALHRRLDAEERRNDVHH